VTAAVLGLFSARFVAVSYMFSLGFLVWIPSFSQFPLFGFLWAFAVFPPLGDGVYLFTNFLKVIAVIKNQTSAPACNYSYLWIWGPGDGGWMPPLANSSGDPHLQKEQSEVDQAVQCLLSKPKVWVKLQYCGKENRPKSMYKWSGFPSVDNDLLGQRRCLTVLPAPLSSHTQLLLFFSFLVLGFELRLHALYPLHQHLLCWIFSR
jgi:hypothetical protein